MHYARVPHVGKPVARIVMGSMVCTTDKMPLTRELLDAYVAAGGNIIDTAFVYAGGKSEAAIGQWMQERGNRDQILILDKGAHPKAGSGPRVNPQAIAEDIRVSLDRLQTDYIDLWLLHRDDHTVPVGPIVECLNEQKAAGRIRAFGGSNWTHLRIREANAYASEHGLQGFTASSPQVSLATWNEPTWGGCIALDAEGKEWHRGSGVPVFAWSSQAGGFFTGRYSRANPESQDIARVWYNETNWARLDRARELSARTGVTANQIALACVLNQPFPVFALVGPRTVRELEESLGALDIRLTSEDLRWLESGDRATTP